MGTAITKKKVPPVQAPPTKASKPAPVVEESAETMPAASLWPLESPEISSGASHRATLARNFTGGNQRLGQIGAGPAAPAAVGPAVESKAAREDGAPRSPRVQRFIDWVKSAKTPSFTKYAAEKWQKKPEESYAEAYSIWLADPGFLKKNYKKIFDFFEREHGPSEKQSASQP